jgi:hypothetical protein
VLGRLSQDAIQDKCVVVDARGVFLQYTQAIDRDDTGDVADLIHDDFRLEGAGLDGIGKGESTPFLSSWVARVT